MVVNMFNVRLKDTERSSKYLYMLIFSKKYEIFSIFLQCKIVFFMFLCYNKEVL